MKKIFLFLFFTLTAIACSNQQEAKITDSLKHSIMQKAINNKIPTIGILIFEGVIMNEVIAALDVFSKSSPEGKALFNVIIIGKNNKTYTSAQGLKIIPDFTIDKVPSLKVLVVPSSYTPSNQSSDKDLVKFVKEQNKTTDFIASHCAGAFLIGATGIADNKDIVTYVTGGKNLQSAYPNLKVADDSKVAVIQDGKLISSNGNLVSYIASLDLLEQLTNKQQRKYVEEAILLDRLIII